jgi:hypothetical protein
MTPQREFRISNGNTLYCTQRLQIQKYSYQENEVMITDYTVSTSKIATTMITSDPRELYKSPDSCNILENCFRRVTWRYHAGDIILLTHCRYTLQPCVAIIFLSLRVHNAYASLFPGGSISKGVKPTTHLNLVLRLRLIEL